MNIFSTITSPCAKQYGISTDTHGTTIVFDLKFTESKSLSCHNLDTKLALFIQILMNYKRKRN